MKKAICGVVLALAALYQAACGYGLVGRTSNLPTDIHSIFVQPLENQTLRQQAELLVTQAIIDELVTRRRFEIVPSLDRADAVLSGTLTAFTARPVTFGAEGRGTQYEIQIRANMNFKRTGTGEVIWQQPQYLFRETYEIDANDPTAYFDPEDETIEEVSKKFAETLVIDLLEGF